MARKSHADYDEPGRRGGMLGERGAKLGINPGSGPLVHVGQRQSSTFVHALAAPAVMSTWHRNPSSSQRSCTHPEYRGGNQTASATTGVHSHNHAIIHSCSSPTASGSVLESTLARAVSRGRRSRPPDRRRGKTLACP